MQNKLEKIFNYETISYLICGILTTLLDWAIFAFFKERFQMDYRICTVLSWFGAVIFAYAVNKLIVFKNFRFDLSTLLREWWSFFSARLITGILVMLLMVLMVDILMFKRIYWQNIQVGEYLAKFITSVFNMVANYLFSKFWIFKKA